MTDGELAYHDQKTVPSIAFHLWHMARWTDRAQAVISDGREIWLEQEAASGMGMDVRTYAAQSFQALENVMENLRESDM